MVFICLSFVYNSQCFITPTFLLSLLKCQTLGELSDEKFLYWITAKLVERWMIEGGSCDRSAGRWHACDSTRNELGPQLGAGGVVSDRCWCHVSNNSWDVHSLSSVSTDRLAVKDWIFCANQFFKILFRYFFCCGFIIVD